MYHSASSRLEILDGSTGASNQNPSLSFSYLACLQLAPQHKCSLCKTKQFSARARERVMRRTVLCIAGQVDISTAGTQWGTGGMGTKLTAARIATAAGCKMVICNATAPESIAAVVLRGERVGTLFHAHPQANKCAPPSCPDPRPPLGGGALTGPTALQAAPFQTPVEPRGRPGEASLVSNSHVQHHGDRHSVRGIFLWTHRL